MVALSDGTPEQGFYRDKQTGELYFVSENKIENLSGKEIRQGTLELKFLDPNTKMSELTLI